jgi:pyruvate decarboxylase
MVKHISVDTVVLSDPETAPSEIDRCLTAMMQQSRPVYIGVPVDMSHLACDASGLQEPIPCALPANDQQLERQVVQVLRNWMEISKNPIIIVDGNAVRNNLEKHFRELSRLTGFPTFTTFMGKGGPDETASTFGGMYAGAGTHDDVKQAVESSDAVFWIGNVQVRRLDACMHSILMETQTDFNTGEFTDNVSEDVTAEFQRFHIKVSSYLRMSYS